MKHLYGRSCAMIVFNSMSRRVDSLMKIIAKGFAHFVIPLWFRIQNTTRQRQVASLILNASPLHEYSQILCIYISSQKHHTNRKPTRIDDQEIPRSVKEIMKAKKTGVMSKKKRRKRTGKLAEWLK